MIDYCSHGLRTGIFEASKVVLINIAPTLPELQVSSGILLRGFPSLSANIVQFKFFVKIVQSNSLIPHQGGAIFEKCAVAIHTSRYSHCQKYKRNQRKLFDFRHQVLLFPSL